MRAATSLSCARSIGKQFRTARPQWAGGVVPSMEPRKQGNENTIKERRRIEDVKTTEPIAAFSRPPPLSPYLGPFLVVTLLDSSWKHDNDEA